MFSGCETITDIYYDGSLIYLKYMLQRCSNLQNAALHCGNETIRGYYAASTSQTDIDPEMWWELTGDGTLVIHGSGSVYNVCSDTWFLFDNFITALVLDDGITSMTAKDLMPYIVSVTCPDSLLSLRL